jgi:PIN domain nuclease of toxin-antitoxin system
MFLLDTHALLWWLHEPERLSQVATTTIRDGQNDIFVSAVSAMEISTKSRLGKLGYETPLAAQFSRQVAHFGFAMLPINCHHAQMAGALAGAHRDPWDRLMAAQAQIEGLMLISKDKELGALGSPTLW